MGKLASKVTKRIMAATLSAAMILSNMTVYASEISSPAPQTSETVDGDETGAAELPATQDETAKDGETQDEGTQDGTPSGEESSNPADGTEGGDGTASGDTGDDISEPEDPDGDVQDPEETEGDAQEAEDGLEPEEVSEAIEAEEPKEDTTGTHTVWVVGDSTVSAFTDNYYYPRCGYGTQIENYIAADSGYTVNNLALSGRSSLSFLAEGNYTTLKNGIKEGDILIVGFGHNDEKAEADRYTNPNGDWQTAGSFAKNLYDNYVKLATDKEAEVILCTPVVRRGVETDSATGKTKLKDSEKHITSTSGSYAGGDYRQAVLKLGTDKDVPVVDLTKLTTDLYESMTPAETLNFHARTQSNESTVDNTHLNIYGAKKVASMFATEVKAKSYTALASAIVSEIKEPTKENDLDPVYPVAGWKDPVYTAPAENPSTVFNPYVIGEGAGQVKFIGTAFGDIGGDSKVSNFTLKTDDQGYMNMVATGNGKLITSGEGSDGLAMYYYRVPKDKMFKISATAVVNSIANESQSSFGLMARDDMYINKSADVLANTNYVAAGSSGNGNYNCFYRANGAFNSKAGLTVEEVKAGRSYDLSIVRNPDGYACTFGKEPTQSGGYDISLTVTDSEYIYIGMFISRTANITFKNIYLEVEGQVLADERKTQYEVTVTNDGHGTASANTPASAGETITLTATPSTGYVLDHWEVVSTTPALGEGQALNIVNNKFTMPAANVAVKAVFAESKFDTATVEAGTKDFTPAATDLTKFAGITFANFEDINNEHGFHSKGSGNPIMNLHLEEGRKASITVLSCCYGAGGGGSKPVTSSLTSSAGVVTNKEVAESSLKGIQYSVLNVEEEHVTLTFANDMYIHNIMVEYAPEESGERKIDVWDFGAKEETNTDLYNNRITSVEWLGYKDSIGSDGKFDADGNYKFGDVTITVLANDRFYSNVAALSGMVAGTNDYKDKAVANDPDKYKSAGAYYCNGNGGSKRRYITIENVQAGDKIVLYMGNTKGGYSDVAHFASQSEETDQDDTFTFSDTIHKQEFIAKYNGTYKIYADASSDAKPIYYRVMRLPGVKVSGTIELNGTELPAGYSLLLVNQTTNGETVAVLDENEDGEPIFTASLAPGYTYKAALAGATGYGFTNASATFEVKNTEILTGKNGVTLVVEEKDTYTFSGKIKGFAAGYEKLNDLKITLTPPATSSDDKVELNITQADDNITFDSTLAPDVDYSLVMEGVNDYELLAPVKVKKSSDDSGTSYENRTITVAARAKHDVSGGFMGLGSGAAVTKLTFTNVADNYVYDAAINSDKDGYSIELRDGEYLANATVTNYTTKTHVVVNGGAVSKDLMFVSTAAKAEINYAADIYVGYPKEANNYATVSEAMEACSLMKRDATTPERVTVHIAPGTYREQVMVTTPNITLENGSADGGEVLLTWYYGIGYKYYSASGGSNSFYDAERAYDKYEKNIASKWGTAVYVQKTATGFRAEGITFENSFNRYVTEEELADGVEVAGNESITFVRNLRSDVASKTATERATAICIEGANAEFKDCSFYSSQDTLYTADTAYFKNCIIEGQTDYIFGNGNCVFDSCELSWKGYSIGSQGGYVTAHRPAADTELGYLFRNCTVTANSHNSYTVTAGYWGRPWGQNAKVTFMNTKLQTEKLIVAEGWTGMSSATADKATGFKEYNTTAMNGAAVDTSNALRKSKLMTDADAAAVDVKKYFGTWTPTYFTDDVDTAVEITGDLSISNNGDTNHVLPGNTLTVAYALNSKANNENDASIVRWYTVKYNGSTPGTPKLVKTANGALDRTYKVNKADIGSYIKVTVTPGTVSGKTGPMKELTLYKTGDYDPVVNEGYYDPSTGASGALGDGVNIFLAGDSTTKDYSENGLYNNGKADNLGSWGEFFQYFFDESEVKIQNYANGGRSTRSFINDGSFKKIEDQISAGDYLFIQFAHNDSSSAKKDTYVPLGEPNSGIYPYTPGTAGSDGKYPDNGTATYKWFLKKYVDMALEKGATPVLLTPVARMYINADNGTMKDHHFDDASTLKEAFGYCKAVKQVYDDYKAQNANVLFIDAYTITEKFYKDAWNATDKNAINNQVMSLTDSTHSNKLGGLLTAAAYAQEIQKLDVTISSAVKAPTNESAKTVADTSNGVTAGNNVFTIDASGTLAAYDLTKDCSARATYWEGIGNTMLTAIKTTAGQLTANGAVATPTATPDPEAGNVASGETVTLSCTETGAKIYYTTDGSNPKVSATRAEYVDGTTTITITKETATIKAYAEKTGMADSKIAVFNYTLAPAVEAPTATPDPGTPVKAGTKITLETATTTEGVQIRYTMGANPADPTKYSTRYDSDAGIIIKTDTTIKAVAVAGEDISEVSTFTYTIDTTASTVKPAKPTSDTPDGAVAINKVVKLSTTTADAKIYYTIGANPADPTTDNADLYDADGITITSSVKIKAVAIKDGVSSDVATFTYTVPTTPAPEFTPPAGSITKGAKVTLTVTAASGTTLSGLKIYYTTDRSNPKSSDTRTEVTGDTAEVVIDADTTIKAYAVSTGMADSDVVEAKYTLMTAPAPTASPDPASPLTADKVTLEVTAEEGTTLTGVKIHYTLDGSNPKNSTTKLTAEGTTVEIPVQDDITIRAYTEAEGYKDSAAVRFEYRVVRTEAPKATPDPGEVSRGTTVHLSSDTAGAEIWYTTELAADAADVSTSSLTTKFESDIRINEDTVIYAYAKSDGIKDSGIVRFVYTVAAAPGGDDEPKTSGAGIKIVGLKDTYDFTGAKITPDFTVEDRGIEISDGIYKELTLGTDYTVKYANNVKTKKASGKSAEVMVIGKGNYAGKTVKDTFDIVDADGAETLENLKGAKIAKISPVNYDGTPQHPDITLTLKGKSAVTYSYNAENGKYETTTTEEGVPTTNPIPANVAVSNNINKGTATILLTGESINNKPTTVKATFKINPVELSKAGTGTLTDGVIETGKIKITVEQDAKYLVKGAMPKVTVRYNLDTDAEEIYDTLLTEGRDYTVKYSANKKAGGKGNIVITGKGNYAKKYAGKLEFAIGTLDMADTKLVAVAAYAGVKGNKLKATVVDSKGDILKASQYTVKAYKEKEQDSDGKDIGKDAYTAADKKGLVAGTTIYVQAEAKDAKNLTGKTDLVEVLVGENIAKAKVELKFRSKDYTGNQIKLEAEDLKVTLKYKEKGQTKEETVLFKSEDDEVGEDEYAYKIVSYSNNINKGTATVVIKGVGKCSGTKTIKFKITAKTMKKWQEPTE